MYDVSARGVDERMRNVHYYYYCYYYYYCCCYYNYSFVSPLLFLTVPALRDLFYREGTDGLYASQTFLLAYTLHTLPFSAVTSVIFSALLYWSVQLFTLLVGIVLHSTGQYSSPLYWSVWLSTSLISTALHSTGQKLAGLHSTGQYSTPLYWSVQLSSLLVSTALHSAGQYSYSVYWSAQLITRLSSADQYSNPSSSTGQCYWTAVPTSGRGVHHQHDYSCHTSTINDMNTEQRQ